MKMGIARKERAIRTLLAALLSSDLSGEEIREVLEDLSRRNAIFFQITKLVEETARLANAPTLERLPNRPSQTVLALNDLLEAIRRRRLSRQELLEIMESVSPSVGPVSFLARNSSIRSLVAKFLSLASERDIERLMEAIKAGANRDEYLAGISRRS